MEELKDRITAIKEEVKTAREERDKAKEVAQKIHSFLGFPGDVLNKAHLYDQGLWQPEIGSGTKMMRCKVDYSSKMEKTLKELRALLQPTGSQPEPAVTPALGPSTVPAPTPSPGFVTLPISQLDPLLQEAIPEINTEDIASLRTWAEGGSGNLTTPTIGTGTNIPDSLSTSGSQLGGAKEKGGADEEESRGVYQRVREVGRSRRGGYDLLRFG